MQLINTYITDKHIQEFEYIVNQLTQMCTMTEQQIRDALQALLSNDIKLASSTTQKDKIINELQINIQDNCNLILMQQPTDSDFRLTLAVNAAIAEIERIADVARKLSNLTRIKYPPSLKPIIKVIEQISELTLILFNQTMEAFLKMDLKEASRLYPSNDTLNTLVNEIKHQLIKAIKQNKIDVRDGIEFFNTIRSLAKIDNRCQNICELIIYFHLDKNVKYKNKDTIINLVNKKLQNQ